MFPLGSAAGTCFDMQSSWKQMDKLGRFPFCLLGTELSLKWNTFTDKIMR